MPNVPVIEKTNAFVLVSCSKKYITSGISF